MGKAKVDLNSVTTVGLDLAKHVFQPLARIALTRKDVDDNIDRMEAARRKSKPQLESRARIWS